MVKKHLLTGVIAVATFAAFSMSDANAASSKSANTKQHTNAAKVHSTYESHSKKVYEPHTKKVKNRTNTHTQVPEPATMALLGSALGGLAFANRLRKKSE